MQAIHRVKERMQQCCDTFSSVYKNILGHRSKKKLYPMKIIDVIETSSYTSHLLIIQYTGRSLVIKKTLHKIIESPEILGALSPNDVEFIMFSYHKACNKYREPRYRLISFNPDIQDNSNFPLKLIDEKTGAIYNKFSHDIMNTPEIYNELSTHDCFTIARVNGMESVLKQTRSVELINRKMLCKQDY